MDVRDLDQIPIWFFGELSSSVFTRGREDCLGLGL